MIRMSREPTITRENTSRPSWSVPNRCALDGALLIAVEVLRVRVVRRDRRAEDRAEDPDQEDRPTPTMNVCERSQLAQQLAAYLALPAAQRAGVLDGDVGDAHSAAREPDARVQQRVERCRRPASRPCRRPPIVEHARLEHREVVLVGGVVGQLADAVVAEQRLDDDQAADQVAGLGRDHGDRRQQRVAQHVAADHHAARQALERRRCARSRSRAPRSCRRAPSARCSRTGPAPAGSPAGSGTSAG